MQVASGVIDPVALAERIEVVALAGVQLARKREGIEHAAKIAERRMLARQARDLGVQEADIEGGVVDHELGARHEVHELRGDLGEARLAREALAAEAVHRERARVDVAVGVQVAVEMPAGELAVDDLDAADLDDAVPVGEFEARGLGVEDDLAHDAMLTQRA